MDCPCLLGRTLNGLTVLIKSPDGVNCLSVRLAACLFDSPAALYLFVSARICSPPHPPQSSTSCFAQTPSLHLTCPTSGSLICRTRIWPPLGPNRRYCLCSLFGMCCMSPSPGVLCFIIHNCDCLSLIVTAVEFMCRLRGRLVHHFLKLNSFACQFHIFRTLFTVKYFVV